MTVLGIMLSPGEAAAQPDESPIAFSSSEHPLHDARAFPPFHHMIDRYAQQVRQAAEGCPERDRDLCILIETWGDAIRSMARLTRHDQLAAVNGYFNRLDYVADPDNWHEADYWATPLEFQAAGGDCEDYAVAKYYTLRGLGFDPAQMRIVVLMDDDIGIQHAVLAVALEGEVYLLDNQISEVVTADEVPHYRPLMSINELGIWQHR